MDSGSRDDGASRRGLPSARFVRVGRVRVDLATWEVSRQGHRSRLQEKPFRVLGALIERPGELATRSELRERLWPDGTIVDFDNNLNSAVASLRTALGDSAKAPRIIETLPRLGYRLIAEVGFEDLERSKEAPGAGVDAARPRRLDSRWLAAAIGVLLVLLAAGVRECLGARVSRPSGLSMGEPSSTGRTAPADSAARQAWQNGLYLFARGSVGDLTLALESFEETRSLEPDFAPVHTKVADTLVRMSFAGSLELRQGLTRARQAATRALELDQDSGAAYRLLALADLHLDWDFESAAGGIESALRLAPDDAQCYLAAATFLIAAGSGDGAVLAAQRAVELDPASSLLQADLGYFLVAAGRHAEALAVSEDQLELEPDSISVLGSRLIAAERLGLFERSSATARRILELRGAGESEIRALAGEAPRAGLIRYRRWMLANHRASADPSHFRLALHQASLQQREPALASLHQAFERREPWLVYLHAYSQFDGLREDPQFVDIVHRLGFPRPDDAVVTRVRNLL